MKLSAFNLYVENFPSQDETLIYNTRSGGFAAVDSVTMQALRKVDAGQELSAEESECVTDEFSEELIGVLVESRGKEEAAYRARHEGLRASTTMLECIVSTTLACNLDCTYCCQADVLDGKTMSAQTGQDTARWLAARALEIG